MTVKPVRPRASATSDAFQAVERYETEAGLAVADRFTAAVASAYGLLGANPGMGSPLIGDRLHRPGLRSWRLAGFPYLVLYFEREDHLDVWRILHGAQDLDAILGEPLT